MAYRQAKELIQTAPANNLAERILRPAVMWRKQSFGPHSIEGCRFVERALTALQTLRFIGR